MRIDELYCREERGTQAALPGLGIPGEVDAMDAQKWVDEHPEEWAYMVRRAKLCVADKGWAPMKLIVEMTRFHCGVSIRNALAPALARIMIREHPEFEGKFKTHPSRCDGYTL